MNGSDRISKILLAVLRRDDPDYLLDGEFVRWGKVETDLRAALESAVAAEGQRIRRELLEWVEAEQRDELVGEGEDESRFGDGWKILEAQELRAALDRIVPEIPSS